MSEMNVTLKKNVERIAKGKQWEVDKWTGMDNAIAAMRTILEELGCKEVLGPEHAEDRYEAAKIILPIFEAGAPINFRRGAMVKAGLAPAMSKSEGSADKSKELA